MIRLSSMWERIQSTLFPFLEEELDELSARQKQLVSILELIRIEKVFFTNTVPAVRRPTEKR